MPARMRYEIEHVSRYLYPSPVRHCVMALCMKPLEDRGQRLFHFEAVTDPPASLNAVKDSFGNTKHLLNVHRRHETLEIVTRSSVETGPSVPLPGSLGAGAWEEMGPWKGSFAHWDFTHPSVFARPCPALGAFVERLRIRPGSDPLESLLRLCEVLHRNFDYVPGSTSAVSPIDHILESGQGVCQDYAHVMIAVARSWGVPARYVSGYMFADVAAGKAPEPATHAWVECLLPGLGWASFDPTNRSVPGDRHVRVAVGRDYRDVPPTRGVLAGEGGSSLEVSVRMRAVPGSGEPAERPGT